MAQSHHLGFRIGSIWIADAANLGASGIINEAILGDDRKHDSSRWFIASAFLLTSSSILARS